ncbi:unnamed protein product [Lupinus luteus]|uniref:Uncharacterized protein n=1 Tax=Lupinus luteus TaxID=3873 RepID=A0AAV1WFC6_LUPLU
MKRVQVIRNNVTRDHQPVQGARSRTRVSTVYYVHPPSPPKTRRYVSPPSRPRSSTILRLPRVLQFSTRSHRITPSTGQFWLVFGCIRLLEKRCCNQYADTVSMWGNGLKLLN